MIKSNTRILFIGLDAAEKSVVIPWAEAGKLPNIKKLLDRGVWADSVNPDGIYVGATWSTFSTGASPAKHQRYCFIQIKQGTYEFGRPKQAGFADLLFWKHLSQAGKRVAVIDVPKADLIENLNGIQVVDWMAHDAEHQSFLAWPKQLKSEIENQFGCNPLQKCDATRNEAGDFIKLRDQLMERIAKKEKMACHYLKQGGWDCFINIMTEAHCAGHHLWHLHDPLSPRYRKEWTDQIGDPLLEIYQALDRSVGSLVEAAGPDATTFLLLSHGMGTMYTGNFALNEFLRRLEKAEVAKDSYILILAKRLWRLLPESLRKHTFKKTRKTIINNFAHRTAFSVPNNDAHGGIRINLAGREPSGKVQPGEDFDRHCDRIIAELHKLVNAETKEKLVLNAMKMSDLYPGRDYGPLPDIVVDWNRSAPIRTVYSDSVGTINDALSTVRSGDHRGGGLVIAAGPEIKTGTIGTVSVMDYAPTLSELLGIKLSHAEGRSFADRLRKNSPVISG